MRHVNPTKKPGVTHLGPFASITPKELKNWLGMGMKVHIRDPRGNTHLHNAVREGAKPFVINFLLKKGLAINAQNAWGETALFIAARDGRDALVEILLNNGADSKIRTNAGYSALGIAKSNGHARVAERLVAHRAKPGR